MINNKKSKDKYCVKCKNLLTSENSREKDLISYIYRCKSCDAQRHKTDHNKNIQKDNEKSKLYSQENKRKVIEAYGRKCVCCGESTPEFLTIDHINNDGASERKITNQGSGNVMYRWLIKNNFPKDNYQLLCFNCNCSKGFYGYCAHQI